MGLGPMVFGSQGSASRNPGLDYVAPSEQKKSKSNRYRFLDLIVALPRQANPHHRARETDRTAVNEWNTIGWRANGSFRMRFMWTEMNNVSILCGYV
uniref:Uncharacterized protein n=1 Tax=Candidatus Kentrum sp. UNK TaxID=2126344 RepID=A0A451AQK8_9GAMM|nr:MAG: hypothetical protein BECKUNK1418G_GA0071005_12242 [Candidatus Kentron sp. UNK]VFK73530.1 MAG: hypothetical protein BECKUNK1418H_GA0071006_12152 [Candidatus Kentron sp. UNK]